MGQVDMARKGAFDPSLIITRASPLAKKEGFTALPKGAAGALAQGVQAAVRDGLRDIKPEMIDDQGLIDRLGETEDDDDSLRASLKKYGQLVPVLLRPSTENPGRYEIIYGRRRVRAAKAIGISVKAIIRPLDGEEAVVAQGQENTARRDLSFIEKARFARLITEEGYSRDVAMEALNCHATVLSVMLSVVRDVPDEVVLKIGPAPGIGRDRWFEFAKQARAAEGSLEALRDHLDQPEIAARESNERFTAASTFLKDAREARPATGSVPQNRPLGKKTERAIVERGSRRELGSIQRSGRGVTIRITAAEQRGFAEWLDSHADDLLTELHARYTKDTGAKQ
jgi:ParB family chromosome partitioning protein